MNVFMTAVLATVVAILDYWWPHLEAKIKGGYRSTVRHALIGLLVIFAWVQALYQFEADRESRQSMDRMRTDLTTVSVTLSNSVSINKGLTIGGDSTAEILFSPADKTNTLSLKLEATGEYPLRSLFVRVTDQTERVKSGFKTPGVVVYNHFFGDYPARGFGELCDVHLDPTITNYFRLDVQCLNGSYRKNLAVSKTTGTTDGWALKLLYKDSLINGKREVDPPEKRGTIVMG